MSAAIQFFGSPVSKIGVDDHMVAAGNDKAGFVVHRSRCTPDQIEQAVAARRDMRAMLNVVPRPVLLRRLAVPFVEQRIERLKNQCLVLLFRIGSVKYLRWNIRSPPLGEP